MAPDWLTDRRAVLRAGAVAGAATVAGGVARSAAAAVSPGTVRFVVADRRIAESLSFASVLQERGAERLDVADGLTMLWRRRLLPHWEKGEGLVAGLTSPAVWACLSQQAGNQFRKVRVLGRHAVTDGAGPAQRAAWPALVAREACAGFPPRERECLTFPVPSAAASGRVLVSWMIG